MPDLLIDPATQSRLKAYKAAPSHALLLSGPVGIGKSRIAAELAAELTDGSSQDNPNLRIIEPVKDVITIDVVREVIRFFKLRPAQTGGHRAVVLIDADAMGTEAQNALLKLLEEPPVHSFLLLTTSRPDDLLPTIHSRLTTIQIAVPSLEAASDYFAGKGLSAAAVKQVYQRSGGSIARLTALARGDGQADDGDKLVAEIKTILTGTTFDRLCLVDGYSKDRTHAEQLVQTLVRMGQVSLEQAARSGNASSLNTWQRILKAALTARDAFERRANVKLALTDLMLSL